MTLFRHFTSVLLALSLLFSGTVGSYGSGLNAGGQMMVICSDVGERNVMIGAGGAEVPVLHDCGECCISVGLHDGPPHAFPAPDMVVMAQFYPVKPTVSVLLPELFELARGPPVFG